MPRREAALSEGGSSLSFKHHACFEDLIASASQGCELCQLFRPYIEHERKRRRTSVSPDLLPSTPCGDDWVRVDYYGESLVDPWKEEERQQNWPEFKQQCYIDLGGRYLILPTFQEQDEKTRQWRESNEPTWKRSRLHNRDSDPGYAWLFALASRPFGPEQIWLECRWRQGNDSNGEPGQRESASLLRLSAGTIHGISSTSSTKYCYQGSEVGGRERLALFLPHLWKWPVVELSTGVYSGPNDSELGIRLHGLWELEFFRTVQSARLDAWSYITARLVSQQCRSPSMFAQLKAWYQTCITEHRLCQTTVDAVPRRLIHVGQPARGRSPCLQEMALIWPYHHHRYAILSHCWGKVLKEDDTLRTTNAKRLLEKIDEHKLAKKFQDAIVITRAIGLQYLWIDALCIVQDCPEDWASEASPMAEYYAGAAICTAGTSASHAQEGLLCERQMAINAVALQGPCETETLEFAMWPKTSTTSYMMTIPSSPAIGGVQASQSHLTTLELGLSRNVCSPEGQCTSPSSKWCGNVRPAS